MKSACQLDLFDNVSSSLSKERGVDHEIFGPPYSPYDAAKIDIERKPLTVYSVMARIENHELDLCPAFQRHADLWKVGQQSRLIESLILNIPLPAFYMTEDVVEGAYRNIWHVVDGLQRLCAMRNFIMGDEKGRYLKLCGLEYLDKYNGCVFSELPPSFKRNIEEAELQIYLIKPSTPDDLKFNIFKRVNTGGLPLNQQEIRHAMHQNGAAQFVMRLAESEVFKKATGKTIRSARMTDREFVNRFLSFYLKDELPEYKDMDSYLNDSMKYLDGCTDQRKEEIANVFFTAVSRVFETLGKYAFRRIDAQTNEPRRTLNKALFESFTVTAARYPDAALELLKHPTSARQRYVELFRDATDTGLNSIVLTSTGHESNIERRYRIVEDFFKGKDYL